MKLICFVVTISFFILLACKNVNNKNRGVSYDDSVKVLQYENKSIHYQNSKPDSAVYFADIGLRFSREIKYLYGEGLMLNRFASVNGQYGNLKLAIKYQKQVLEIFKSLNDHTKIAEATSDLGFLEGKYGNIEAGSVLINNALNIYKKKVDTVGMVMAYTKLGEVMQLAGYDDKALGFYKKAEQLLKELPISSEYLNLIAQIGKTHAKLGKHQQALDYFKLGINKSNAEKNIKSQILFLNHAGTVLNLMGNKSAALVYQHRSVQQAKLFKLPEEQARSLLAIATTLKDSDAIKSIIHLKNALEIAHSLKHRQLSSEIYQSLSNVYIQQFRYEEAIKALQLHYNLLDSVEKENDGNKTAILQNSYELAESKLDIKQLKFANDERTKERNLIFRFGIALLIISSVLAFYFFRARQLNRKLQKSNHIKDKLFSIIGHDLRNPIGGITQLLAIMDEEKQGPGEYQLMISEMRKQGNISLEILNALLNWGEAQLKGIHIKPSVFDAKSVIAKNIAALQMQSRSKPVSIDDQTDAGILIYGDMNHFDFVIRNLLSNAIKFSRPSGKVVIMADNKLHSDLVVFSVMDYGKGISKGQQELFLKSNLDISFGTSGEKGTGIGLMLSKEFITANHGKIWIKSEEKKGTTFYFSFPKKTD